MTQNQIDLAVFIAAGGTIAFFIGKFKIENVPKQMILNPLANQRLVIHYSRT